MNNFHNLSCRLVCVTFPLAITMVAGLVGSRTFAQSNQSVSLVNGGFERASNSKPDGWIFSSQVGSKIELDRNEPFEGRQSALIDATVIEESPESQEEVISNLMQPLDARLWRGKRVRFKAAVRTEDLKDAARAQLWFRVDRLTREGERQTGSFDNMLDRPIRNEQWKTYEIVLDVDEDAEKLFVGMFLVGTGKAWLDAADLEVVGVAIPTTESSETRSQQNTRSSASRFPPILMKALGEAENAPKQSFFTPWLLLVVVALTLFALSGLPPKKIELKAEGIAESIQALGLVPKFALHFSVAYWLLYSLPEPISSLVPYVGPKLNEAHIFIVDKIVHWTAANAFGINGQLVPVNGSGDTTFAYINILIWFVLALIIASVWSLIDRRQTDYRWIKDFIRSYLRYIVAFAMLSYGLAKAGWATNQFQEPGTFQLARNYGDSSPMGLLWTFMGSSQAYTFFAGMGEATGALLLIWRRTATLGAIIVLGVMTNVMMLNFCYDVPVKIYSAHLVCMALYILLPDAGRLVNILLLNRPADKTDFRPPYAGPKIIWIQRVVKAVIIVSGFAWPIYNHINAQANYFAAKNQLPEYFGRYEVEEFKIDGEAVAADSKEISWSSVEFDQKPYNSSGEQTPTFWLSVSMSTGDTAAATFALEKNESVLSMTMKQSRAIPEESIHIERLEDNRLKLSGKLAKGEFEATLKPSNQSSRLLGRGFRWINEVPFNR